MSVILNIYNKVARKFENKTVLDTSDIEYGQNSNGEYWKYPNGQLVCKSPIIWKNYTMIQAGSLGFVDFTDFWLFPHEFNEDYPFVHARGLYGGSGVWAYAIGANQTKVSSITFFSHTVVQDAKTNFQLIAIGRWK